MPASSLRANRDFQLLCVGGFLAALGNHLSLLALPLLVLAKTGSSALAGLVGSAAMASLVIAMIPGGAIADSVERHRLMLVCQIGLALTAAGLAVAVGANCPVLPVALVAAVITAALGCMDRPATTVLVRIAVADRELGVAMSRLRARSAAAGLAGPLLGGMLYARSHVLPFTVQAVALTASVGCLLAVRARAAPAPRKVTVSRMAHLFGGMAFVWREPYLRTVLMIFGVGVNAGFAGVMLAVIASSGRADPSGRTTGFVAAFAAVGSLVGALAAPRLRAERWPRTVILATCWISAVGVGLLTVTSPLWQGPLIGIVLAMGSVASIAFATTMMLRTPVHTQGRVEAAASLVSMAGQPAGPLAAGLLLDRFGPQLAFALFAVVFVACAVAATVAKGLTATNGGSWTT